MTSTAHFLYDKIPVVCIVFNPETSKGVTAVVNTWGKHCNEIRYISIIDIVVDVELNLRESIFHCNNQKEGRQSAYTQT